MPISLTFWSIFGSCGKMLKIFIFLNFFFENFTLTIFINALDPDPDPDPDPGSGSGSASEF